MNIGFRRRADDLPNKEMSPANDAPVPAPATPTSPPVARTVEPPQLAEDNTLDFVAIYRHTGVESVPFSAEQTLDLLSDLSDELPLATQRQTVDAMIRAMGAAIGASAAGIVGDATRKRDSLVNYSREYQNRTDRAVDEAENEIAELRRKIELKEAEIAEAKRKNDTVGALCDDEAGRLETVLSFFGQVVAPRATDKYVASDPITATMKNFLADATTDKPTLTLLNDDDAEATSADEDAVAFERAA